MGLNLLTTLATSLFPSVAPQQPSIIQKTDGQQKPATPIEQVNAILPTPSEQDLLKEQLQLHATVESGPVKPETAIPDDGIKIGISKKTIQELLTFIEPFLRDVKGNLDKLLSKPFDKPTTGIELMEKFFSIPLARKILDATGNYMGELSSKAAVLHPEQTQAATVPTPA
jgi:hypothetical protein